tara:strand:+ start:77 stop:598 length:522 start_codon:yes stop_codon:yes gene_type:complete
MIIDLKEHLPVIIEKHPFYESINNKLMEQVNSLPFSSPDQSNPYTNVIADQYTLRDDDVGPTIKLIQDWIKELISINLVRKGVNLSRFIMWFSRYAKGQGANNHDHLVASSFSAVYFVNTPKGSSPLVFPTSGKKIKAEEGKIVIFPASLRHMVPQNKSKDRVTLAFNICFER